MVDTEMEALREVVASPGWKVIKAVIADEWNDAAVLAAVNDALTSEDPMGRVRAVLASQRALNGLTVRVEKKVRDWQLRKDAGVSAGGEL